MKMGFYMAIEGPSRSGKTTQIKNLTEFWQKNYPEPLVVTREPGAGPGQSEIADKIRDIVQGETAQGFKEEMNPWTEACLYAATRAQTLRRVVFPALRKGHNVLADRSFVSSLAFQGGGRGLGIPGVLELNLIAITDWDTSVRLGDWGKVVKGEIATCIYNELVAKKFPGEELERVASNLLYMACEAQNTGNITIPANSLPSERNQVRCHMAPFLVLHLDISPEEIFRRELDVKGDKFEGLDIQFHRRVRDAYFECKERAPVIDWVTVNGDPEPGLTPEQLANEVELRKAKVFEKIIKAISPYLPRA